MPIRRLLLIPMPKSSTVRKVRHKKEQTVSFKPVFDKLKRLLQQYEGKLLTTRDCDLEKYLQTGYHLFSLDQSGKKRYFGGIYERKKGVALHLMPVYCDSDLLKTSPAEIQQLLNGKACFLIPKLTSGLEKQLETLFQRAYEVHNDASN